MIGRKGNVTVYGLIGWAVDMTRQHKLKPLEAHLLLLLAARYADLKDCTAFPSIETIALDCGLKPTRSIDKRTGRVFYRHQSISDALARLQELGLIWSKQAGRGRTARRELLYNPTKHSATTEGNAHDPLHAQPSGLTEGLPSALADGELARETDQLKHPLEQARKRLPSRRKASDLRQIDPERLLEPARAT